MPPAPGLLIPFLLVATFLSAQTPAPGPTPVPDPTLPPASAHLRLTAVGIGVQIYTCTPKDAAFTWVFTGPRADLFDPGTQQPVGTHTEGPTWTWNDGSSLTGTLLAQRPAAQPADNVAWLLLSAHPAAAPGALSSVTFVRRSDTQGGMPTSSTCDAAHAGTVAQVPYRATYTFYSTN